MLTPRRMLPLLLILLLCLPLAHSARAADDPAPIAGGADLPDEKVLFLTFDDGPLDPWTGEILDVLAEFDAQATFFVLGASALSDPEIIKRMYDEGHGLGNHSWSHYNLTGLAKWAFDAELEDTGDLLGDKNAFCLRPPYGAIDDTVTARAADLGYETVKWTVDPQDWRQPGAQAIARNVIENAAPNAIVLLHDGGGDRAQTVAALRFILRRLGAQGWQFKALCRDVRPIDLTPTPGAEPPLLPQALPTAYSEENPDGEPYPTPTAEETPLPAGPGHVQGAPRAAKPARAATPTPTATPLPAETPAPDQAPRPPRTPPAGEPFGGFTVPAEGATVSGRVLVQGFARHPNFLKWQLDLLNADGDSRFLALGETPLAEAGPLVEWDTRRVPNGLYTLRLRVVHDQLEVAEFLVSVEVANP